MNTNIAQDGEATQTTSETNTNSRGPGRPIVPTATRVIRLDKETHKPFLRGAPKVGEEYEYVTVHRSITASTYVHGTSAIVGEPVIKTTGNRKPRVKKAVSSVNVNVITPTQENVAPAATEAVEVNPLG